MRGRRAVALWAVGWAVVAVAGAALVWGVISRAGDGVTQGIDALPSAERSAGSSTSGPPDREPSGRAGSSTSPPPPVNRTWQGAAGVVSAECRGTVVRLTGATPTSGYDVEVDDPGPERVRVEFESDESRTRVEAECVGGAPEFSEDRSGED